MDPTTLVTFLFKAPPEARTVELLGSWDNFNQPYRMFNDLRRGKGFWSGCFKFHNIIFDGDKSNWTKPRAGGLKQGGTYWYYYRLDDEIETYDDFKEYSTSCPLLPGQTLNVIEVPIEIEERPNRLRSASCDVLGTLTILPSMHTLEPEAKFAALEPPPISKVHDRCISDLALNGRLENNADSTGDSTAPPPGTNTSEHIQNHLTVPRPPARFYLNSGYTDDRSSTYSRRSWSSDSASIAHSAAVNVYGVKSSLIDDTKSLPQSFPDIPRHDSPSRTDMSHGQLYRHDSRLECDDDAANTSGQLQRSDLRIPSSNAKDGTKHPAANDYDLSDYHPPISQQISWLGADTGRPRLFLQPNAPTEIRAPGETISNLRTAPPHSSPGPTTLETVDEVASPRQSEDQVSEPAESDAYDLYSPTFSAATVSSTGGVNTPYRLSVTHSFTGSIIPAGSDSIESVAERLRLWGSIEDDQSQSWPPPPILEEVDETTSSSLVTGYALPSDEAMQSTQSLVKLPGGQTGAMGARPTVVVAQREESTFAESILSELGYLGSSVCIEDAAA